MKLKKKHLAHKDAEFKIQYKKFSKKINKKDKVLFNDKKLIITFIVFGIFSFAFVIFSMSKLGAKVLNHSLFKIIIKIIISAFFIFLAFYKKEKVRLYSSLLLIIYAILIWIKFFFLSSKFSLFLSFTWVIISILFEVFEYLTMKNKKERSICRLDFIIMLIFLDCIIHLNYFKTINDNAFLYPVILSSLISLLITIIILIIKRELLKDRLGSVKHPKITTLFIPLITLIMAFLFSYLFLNIINYSLDFSEPITYEYEVIKKDVSAGYRQATTFDFYIEVNNKEIKISVSSDIYYNIEIGDYINISLYRGFLKEPYLIYEKNSN